MTRNNRKHRDDDRRAAARSFFEPLEGRQLMSGGALDAPETISIALYLLLLGVALPMLGFAGDGQAKMQLAAAVAAAVGAAACVRLEQPEGEPVDPQPVHVLDRERDHPLARAGVVVRVRLGYDDLGDVTGGRHPAEHA